jgi:hypothetical protein
MGRAMRWRGAAVTAAMRDRVVNFDQSQVIK